MQTSDVIKQAGAVHKFTDQEIAHAVAFIQTVQCVEGGLIVGPVAMLQIRYGLG